MSRMSNKEDIEKILDEVTEKMQDEEERKQRKELARIAVEGRVVILISEKGIGMAGSVLDRAMMLDNAFNHTEMKVLLHFAAAFRSAIMLRSEEGNDE